VAAATIRDAFPDPWLRTFSVKANDVAAIVRLVCERGFGANVVSRGEWAVARAAGLPNHRTTLEGIGKTDADLRAAIAAARAGKPLRWLAIESLDEATVLGRLASVARLSAPLDVLYRLNPDVGAETHRGLAVGTGSSKFGLTEAEIPEAIAAAGGPDRPLRARGIHLHVGSQLGAVDAWRDAVRRALAVLGLLRGSMAGFDTFDVGGGFPVGPLGEPAPSPARFAAELPALLDAIPVDRRPARLAIEPGRFLVARATFLVSRVLHARDREGRQVVLDTGMTELIRPALYGARHPIVALTSLGRAVEPTDVGDQVPARVEGPICETTDSLGEHPLPPLRRGDLVAIRDAGAYGASFSSTYNGRPRPPQVLIDDDGAVLLARARGRLRP
jgi:diaminopimelate decarboxylase